jgi:hypothetical protein
MENTESTIRQYDLRQRAVALGWPIERIIVIDTDLGQSAATAADREGFQKLVTEVSLEKAGIVLGLEVSRLARNSTDWHRLSFSDEAVHAQDRMEGLLTPSYPENSGRCSRMFIPDTSRGGSMRRTCSDSARMLTPTARIAGRVHRARDPRCCKA